MLIAFTYLPGFVTMVFRGMPTVWRGRHRLIGDVSQVLMYYIL
jgi:hypothetical protein